MTPRRRIITRRWQIIAASMLAGTLIATTPTVASASAQACPAWRNGHAAGAGTGGSSLNGVAMLSRRNAWAVGYSGGGAQTLIEHWDGTSWTVLPSPNPSFWSGLWAVAATSSRNVWAVGLYFTHGGQEKTLIERWNGTAGGA